MQAWKKKAGRILDTALDWFWLIVYLVLFPLRWLLAVLCLPVRYVGSKCFSENKKKSKKRTEAK